MRWRSRTDRGPWSRVRVLLLAGIGALAVTACSVADDDLDGEPATVTSGPRVAPPVADPPPGPEGDHASPPAGPAVEVLAVVDGDTLDVRTVRGQDRVRLVGMNAPEGGECLAGAATRRLEELVADGPVRLERDVSDRDAYGRLLRHVLVAGRSVGEQLVAEGLAIARAYPPDTGRQDELDAAQRRAEAARRGMWSGDACGRPATAAVDFGAVRPDPPGDESRDPNTEWVEVVNRGRRAVDLTGWGVRDESARHRFTFPAGFRLAPGAAVRFRTGCGRDTTTDLHWCVQGSAVWNNDGDTAFLTDPRGNVVVARPL